MISIDDVQVLRATLDNTPTNLREDRAIQNIFHAIAHFSDCTPAGLPGHRRVALEKFDTLSGIDKLRETVTSFGWCNESFNSRFEVVELIQLRRMWIASEWDFFPDSWTDSQLVGALAGTPPRFDDNGRPL